ncbi:MAG: recombination protein O N-terminal domain-containing protein [Patescibacteria group bacterium]
MRHKYETRGIVLSRSSLGEANAFVILLTSELGLVRARAQGVRRPGAKLTAALATFAESSVVLVRGREGWRVAGSVLEENWFKRMQNARQRRRASRVSGLLLRLVAGEAHDVKLFPIIRGFFEALTELPEKEHEAAEVLAALLILSALGLDTGGISSDAFAFTPVVLARIEKERSRYIARINRGITASGL